MFDLGMVDSYVAFLREEGIKAILSSLPKFSEEKLRDTSLPLLSWCYFSADYANEVAKWERLFSLDLRRYKAVVGNDIFRCSEAEIYSDQGKLYQEAADLIRLVWPEYFEMIEIIRPRMARTIEVDPFESASDPKTFGQILYRMDSDDPVKWAEILVHELGHHYLNIVVTTHDDQEVFDQPWDETKYSAIRDTDRPLIGIYHGAFAQACMLGLALRILKQEVNFQKYQASAWRIINRFSSTFQKDYETIRDRGVLTFDEHILEIIESIKLELEAVIQPLGSSAVNA